MNYKLKRKKERNILIESMDYLDRCHFVVPLIVIQVVLKLGNEFDPYELFSLNVVVVMQQRILLNLIQYNSNKIFM